MPEVSTTYNFQNSFTLTQLLPDFHYISGPLSKIAVYISENGAEPELYYTITDHLGSIVAIADEEGEIIEEQRYDPWGNYRNPQTGTLEENPQLTMLYRGYTGHEMLPEFGLINMNGRLYDPVIACVLSPDNYVQNPYNPQNYNRYSYCYNNPLSYTDPDGEFVLLAGISAFIMTGGINMAMGWKGWQGSGIPTLMAGVGAMAGAAVTGPLMSKYGYLGFNSGFKVGAASGQIGGFVGGFGTSYMRGGSIGDSFKEGYWGSISGCLSGGIFGGMLSGINALLLGGDFWTGENATIACYGTCVITDFSDEIVLGEELKYSSEYAEGFRSEYFSYVEDYTHVRHVYADNSLPPSKSIMNRMPRYIQKGDHVFSIKNGREVLGIASYLGSNLNLTDIYLYKSAFTSYEQLYLTMGHEFLHAALFTSSSYALSEELHHAMIYEWQYLQAKAWGFSKADYYENLYNTYAPGNWSALYHYSKFGFLVVSIQPWK